MESMWRCEFKEKTAQLTLLYSGRTFRSSDWRCAIKKPVLKNLAISTGNTCVGGSFLKTFKKRLQHRCFPVNFAKYLTLLILKKNWKRLLFDCFNGSLLHGPKGSTSRLYDNVRLQTFDESIKFLTLVSTIT